MIDGSDSHKNLKRQSKLAFYNESADYETIDLRRFNKASIQLVKSIYVGYCVLELSNVEAMSGIVRKCNYILERSIWKYIRWILVHL